MTAFLLVLFVCCLGAASVAAQPSVGSVPTLEPPLGSVPTVEPQVGSVPTVEPPLGSVPTVEPPLGSVPTVEPPVGSVPTEEPPVWALGLKITQDECEKEAFIQFFKCIQNGTDHLECIHTVTMLSIECEAKAKTDPPSTDLHQDLQ